MKRERLSRSIVLLTVSAIAVGGCGGAQMGECDSGEMQPCTCPSGSLSHATCSSARTWGACLCPTADMAMPPDMSCSGQIDDLHHCCHGPDCCAATNHSSASGMDCVCETGYVPGPDFSSTNRVCIAGAPDLQVNSFAISYLAPSTSGGSMSICVNQQPDGTQTSQGDYVVIDNLGNGNAGPFKVGLGVYDGTNNPLYCTGDLAAPNGLLAGNSLRLEGPLCCTIPSVPAGSYYLFVFADDYDTVAESNENNNSKLSASKVNLL